MTPAEVAQHDADVAASQAAAAESGILNGNHATILATINTRLAEIRTARTAIANGTIFTGLNANEKAVIDGLLEDDVYLARLALGLFDGTT